MAKSHKHSYSTSTSQISKYFVMIHSNVWGPISTSNTHNFSYFVTFIDDCTSMSWIYFLKKKS